jgi:hypothetical protein
VEEVEPFEASHPIGTKARLALPAQGDGDKARRERRQHAQEHDNHGSQDA